MVDWGRSRRRAHTDQVEREFADWSFASPPSDPASWAATSARESITKGFPYSAYLEDSPTGFPAQDDLSVPEKTVRKRFSIASLFRKRREEADLPALPSPPPPASPWIGSPECRSELLLPQSLLSLEDAFVDEVGEVYDPWLFAEEEPILCPEVTTSIPEVNNSITENENLDLEAAFYASIMEHLPIPLGVTSQARQKAMQEARKMQKNVMEDAAKNGKSPPPYVLMELIGKGSFGRVYKGKKVSTGKVVAIKIIDLDAGDSMGGRGTDTLAEFQKEVKALETLRNINAPNINHVIEAFAWGVGVWMITDFCGGGSIATLMRPSPKGLKEEWMIPILRELAVAVQAVHEAELIHRDLKCANVLITEDGLVQLCDFGVAGMMAPNMDKRSTFIGTPHWMAPEIWDLKYGKEVDIWAFGSFAYEMATGMPPNARAGVRVSALGDFMKSHIPRLEGDQYSEGLKDLVACCLVEDPSQRPTIYQLQQHPYIAGSDKQFPTTSLVELVKAFKKWEEFGGSRRSLFFQGGAAGPIDASALPIEADEWNFSTTETFDEAVGDDPGREDIINVYGRSVNLNTDWTEAQKPRRRGPPESLSKMKAPIEKLFDPDTLTSYHQNSKSQYGRRGPGSDPTFTSDLALRDDSAPPAVRESVIDLGDHDAETGISTFQNLDTLRSIHRGQGEPDFSRPARSDPADDVNRRATQEWKFPSMAAPASAAPEAFRFPPLQPPAVTPGSGGRPTLRHHPTEPIAVPTQHFPDHRESILIDLDEAEADAEELVRPSTADSSTSNEHQSGGGGPFHWDAHSSITAPPRVDRSERVPSLFLSEDMPGTGYSGRNGNGFGHTLNISDFSASEFGSEAEYTEEEAQESDLEFGQQNNMPRGLNLSNILQPRGLNLRSINVNAPPPRNGFGVDHFFPPLPAFPNMSSDLSSDAVADELQRMIRGLSDQLEGARAAFEHIGPNTNRGSRGADGATGGTGVNGGENRSNGSEGGGSGGTA